MRQVWITKVGAPDVLQVREAPDPTPGPGEVRIRVEASGINFADISARIDRLGPMVDGPAPAGRRTRVRSTASARARR